MKKILHILFLVPLAVLLTGCLGDNYEQPNAAVYGSVTDAETGELILQDIGGEGSYIEPNNEFGFGMYEAIREVLCKKPEGGFPVNYAPHEVGLGPYDYPKDTDK